MCRPARRSGPRADSPAGTPRRCAAAAGDLNPAAACDCNDEDCDEREPSTRYAEASAVVDLMSTRLACASARVLDAGRDLFVAVLLLLSYLLVVCDVAWVGHFILSRSEGTCLPKEASALVGQ